MDIASLFSADQTDFIPKIFVVDINPKVKDFWLTIKIIFNCSTSTKDLLQNLLNNKAILNEILKAENDLYLLSCFNEILELLKDVSKKFGFERLKKTVKNLVSITHDWTDPKVFHKIKNICHSVGLDKIYAYSSNILDCISSEAYLKEQPTVLQMLKNISLLDPRASIFSNIDVQKSSPTKMICYPGSPTCDQLEKELGGRVAIKRYAQVLSSKFKIEFNAKRFPEALVLAEEAYQLYSRLPNLSDHSEKLELSDLSHNLGATYHELGQIRKAFLLLDQSFKLRKSINEPEKKATIERLQRIADIIMTSGASPSL